MDPPYTGSYHTSPSLSSTLCKMHLFALPQNLSTLVPHSACAPTQESPATLLPDHAHCTAPLHNITIPYLPGRFWEYFLRNRSQNFKLKNETGPGFNLLKMAPNSLCNPHKLYYILRLSSMIFIFSSAFVFLFFFFSFYFLSSAIPTVCVCAYVTLV